MQTFNFALTARILLLANSAHACLIYNGVSDGTTLQAAILDNGQKVCSLSGSLSPDGLFHLNCIEPTFAADVTPTGLVKYTDPSGSYQWQATSAAANQWSVCQPGCGNNECFSTDIHVGDSIINYGNLNPNDVLTNLNIPSLCSGGTCDSTPQTMSTQYTDGGAPETLILTITVDGTYDAKNPAVLDGLVDAIQATGNTGWTNTTQHWRTGAQGPHWDTTQTGDINLFQQTSFIGATISDLVTGEQTPWALTVTLESAVAGDQGGACAAITGALGAIVGLMNPGAGGILGVLSIGCGLISGA